MSASTSQQPQAQQDVATSSSYTPFTSPRFPPTSPKVRLTVLISGSGSNLQAVIDDLKLPAATNSTSTSTTGGKLPPCEIISVLSNRAKVLGLQRAKDVGIRTKYHNLMGYYKRNADPVSGARTAEGDIKARREYDERLAELVLEDAPDLVLCLGFMHILGREFLEPLEKEGVQIINLHPALPGAFNGIQAIERAHEAWKKGEITKTGVMIHKVIAAVDEGQPVVVKEIPFVEGEDDDVKDFAQKVHRTEWPAVIEGASIIIREILDQKSAKGQ